MLLTLKGTQRHNKALFETKKINVLIKSHTPATEL
jgi:hypothetical protein